MKGTAKIGSATAVLLLALGGAVAGLPAVAQDSQTLSERVGERVDERKDQVRASRDERRDQVRATRNERRDQVRATRNERREQVRGVLSEDPTRAGEARLEGEGRCGQFSRRPS